MFAASASWALPEETSEEEQAHPVPSLPPGPWKSEDGVTVQDEVDVRSWEVPHLVWWEWLSDKLLHTEHHPLQRESHNSQAHYLTQTHPAEDYRITNHISRMICRLTHVLFGCKSRNKIRDIAIRAKWKTGWHKEWFEKRKGGDAKNARVLVLRRRLNFQNWTLLTFAFECYIIC